MPDITATVIETEGVLVAIAPHVRISKPLIQEGIIAHIGANAFAIYVALASHAGKDGTCFPTLARLGEITGMCRTLVTEAVARLVDEELVQKIGRREGGGSTIYAVRQLGTPSGRADGGSPAERMGVVRPAGRERASVKESHKRQQRSLPLFDPVSPAEAADAAAFLLRIGLDGGWVKRNAHRWTLARCQQARDYALPRAKKGGLPAYLRRALEEGYGLPAQLEPICGPRSVAAMRAEPMDALSVAAAAAMPACPDAVGDELAEKRAHSLWVAECRKRLLFAKEKQPWPTPSKTTSTRCPSASIKATTSTASPPLTSNGS